MRCYFNILLLFLANLETEPGITINIVCEELYRFPKFNSEIRKGGISD